MPAFAGMTKWVCEWKLPTQIKIEPFFLCALRVLCGFTNHSPKVVDFQAVFRKINGFFRRVLNDKPSIIKILRWTYRVMALFLYKVNTQTYILYCWITIFTLGEMGFNISIYNLFKDFDRHAFLKKVRTEGCGAFLHGYGFRLFFVVRSH